MAFLNIENLYELFISNLKKYILCFLECKLNLQLLNSYLNHMV